MKRFSRRPALIVAASCVAVVLMVAYALAREGLQHIEPASEMKIADQDWQRGRPIRALIGHARAWLIAVDAGARWKAADIYINQMVTERGEGASEQALGDCNQAVDILRSYDDEGSLSYECFAIEAEIKKRPTSTSPPQ